MSDLQRRHVVLALAAALAGSAPAAWAQGAYPERPVRLIVGFPPGTAPDILARLLGERLAEVLKQQVVVDNRPGAGGQIATQAGAKAAPDGYTLLLAEVGSIAIAPAASSKLPYDPARELIGISEVAKADFVLAVPATSPHRTVAEFVKAARAQTDKVNFGTFGAGTPGHFSAEVFAEAAGFKVQPVHYRATGDAVTALIAGDVAAAFISTSLASAQIKGGRMRGLATTAAQPSSLLPGVPTFAEAGYPKLDTSAWFVVFAPAGTPAPVVDLLSRQIVAAVRAPDAQARLVEAGFSVGGTSRADTERMIKTESQRWGGIVKASGFRMD